MSVSINMSISLILSILVTFNIIDFIAKSTVQAGRLKSAVDYQIDFGGDKLWSLPQKNGNIVIWNNNSYIIAQWKAKCNQWDRKYPKLSKHPSESLQQRTAQTGADDVKQHCWDRLRRLPNSIFKLNKKQTLYPEQKGCLSTFRIDIFGNVVTKDAQDGAICKFDIDHGFPWIRGGRSERANFGAVYWGAN